MSLSIPPGGGNSWPRVEPIVRVQPPPPVGDWHAEADSQRTRAEGLEAQKAAARRRNHVREHPIQRDFAGPSEDSSPDKSSARPRSSANQNMTGRELLFWAIVIALGFLAVFWR